MDPIHVEFSRDTPAMSSSIVLSPKRQFPSSQRYILSHGIVETNARKQKSAAQAPCAFSVVRRPFSVAAGAISSHLASFLGLPSPETQSTACVLHHSARMALPARTASMGVLMLDNGR